MLNLESLDIQKQKINELEKVEELKNIFPEIFEDGKINIEKFKNILFEIKDEKTEHYSFNWNGKQDCYKIIKQKSNLTLKVDEDKTIPDGNNVFIEGDNLEVLKLLQTSYHKKIKMIYIDPPYNKDKDFVYSDTWGDTITNYLIQTDQLRDEGYTSTKTSSSGRRHTNWLNMIYPRLWLSRNLLKDDGVIFVSIDDDEVANLRKVMDEIYGEENFVGQFPRITKKAGKSSDELAVNHDYVLAYSKNNEILLNSFEHTDDNFKYSDEYENERGLYKLNQTLDYGSIQYSPSLDYEIELDNKIFIPGNVTKEEMQERQKRNPKSDFCWRWSKELFKFGLENGFIVAKGNRIYTKTYQNAKISKGVNGYFVDLQPRTKSATTLDLLDNKFSNDNSKKDLSKIFDKTVFDYSKPVDLIKYLVFLGTNEEDIILDFFAGSGTTAHAVMELNKDDEKDGKVGNRKYILVQLPEATEKNSEAFKNNYKKISDITKARIKKVIKNLDYKDGFKSYKLDSSNFQVFKELKKRPNDSFEDIVKMLKMSVFNKNIFTQNAKEIDIVYEVGLKNGFSLSAKNDDTIKLGNYKFIKLFEETREFYFCFADKIELDIAEFIPKDAKLICFDKALDDSAKMNLKEKIDLETL
ncbi:site-specific DNA-methyltransferase [Aliarcobacter skirrowii]|uniref:site-specific DNA-methyltransferase n=1 Tax=Aliarcobacter skirrowii TaxID=28200 RepID=UPI0021B21588|nr:DNA methyltransferase [Aliarcobacter skirrowii]MCT7446957.1 DNA methyltransferase [Aliarcobacter skirrowii]